MLFYELRGFSTNYDSPTFILTQSMLCILCGKLYRVYDRSNLSTSDTLFDFDDTEILGLVAI